LSAKVSSTSSEFELTPNRRLKFEKRSEHFIGLHNKTPGIATLCGHNPKLSALVIGT
jgi:hypothetical protein